MVRTGKGQGLRSLGQGSQVHLPLDPRTDMANQPQHLPLQSFSSSQS
jgi:hypothetical protein